MPHTPNDRRGFIKKCTAAAAAGRLSAGNASQSQAAKPSAGSHPIRLGARVFNAPKEPEALALAHRELGYRAAYCPNVTLDETQRIRDIIRGFAKHDVVIAEVGRWCNLLAADESERAANLEKVSGGLALADEIGALCCVDIAGSYSSEAWHGPHPDNLSQRFFDESVENARKIIDAVKPRRAKFCFEMMGWSLPDSADSYLKMLKAVDRDAFGVHLDAANLVNCPSRYYDTTKLLNECFDKLGPWIVSCHAKDVAWDVGMQIQFRECPLGTGTLDYKTYLKRLAALPADVPLMVEHMKGAEEYDACRLHLKKLAPEIGVRFE